MDRGDDRTEDKVKEIKNKKLGIMDDKREVKWKRKEE